MRVKVLKFDHFHMFTDDPEATALWYRRHFGVRVFKSLQSDGATRIDMHFGDGTVVYVAKTPANAPRDARTEHGPRPGIEHLGFAVDDVDGELERLRNNGVRVIVEPWEPRPGVRIAYVLGPDDVRIELLRRDPVMDFPAPPQELGV